MQKYVPKSGGNIYKNTMDKRDQVFIAGHTGLVGSSLVKVLKASGYTNLVLRTHSDLDLRDQKKVYDFFKGAAIDVVYLAAGRVGGVVANETRSAEFFYDNLMISTNVIHAAAENGVKRLVFFGSSCVYPRECAQPMTENQILQGPVEPTSEGYATAKIAGMKLCEHYRKQYKKNFISVIPANLYGPNDNFHPTESHVIPAMLKRMHDAKKNNASEVVIWGSGKPTRDFLFVDDLTAGLPEIVLDYSDFRPLNLGSGFETSIAELAESAARVVEFKGKLKFDLSKPDGAPRKVLDSTRAKKLGWAPKHPLERGLKLTYEWALDNLLFS
jgi:GDP-L-fucose synthase